MVMDVKSTKSSVNVSFDFTVIVKLLTVKVKSELPSLIRDKDFQDPLDLLCVAAVDPEK
jgi:hypothetical protein